MTAASTSAHGHVSDVTTIGYVGEVTPLDVGVRP